MSSAAQTKDITSHMVAFIKTHGGLDLDEFYDEHAESEVTDIIVEYTKMLLAAVKDDDNKAKLEGLAKKLTPSKKSSCKKKDPDAPKRGKSSYIFFTQEHREKAKKELMKEHGDDFENKMVMSRLGEMWSALKASTKAKDKKEVEKFEKMAADDKERYQAEKEDYTPPSEEELSEKLSSKKKRKDPNAPKRGKSAYIFFTQEHREKAKKELMEEHGDDFENKMVMSRLGELWNEMKESTKPKDKKAGGEVREDGGRRQGALPGGDGGLHPSLYGRGRAAQEEGGEEAFAQEGGGKEAFAQEGGGEEAFAQEGGGEEAFAQEGCGWQGECQDGVCVVEEGEGRGDQGGLPEADSGQVPCQVRGVVEGGGREGKAGVGGGGGGRG
jgi:hypothetical protein